MISLPFITNNRIVQHCQCHVPNANIYKSNYNIIILLLFRGHNEDLYVRFAFRAFAGHVPCVECAELLNQSCGATLLRARCGVMDNHGPAGRGGHNVGSLRVHHEWNRFDTEEKVVF